MSPLRFKEVIYHGDIVSKILYLQYIPRNMHTVFALLCFVVVIHLLIFPISIRLTSLALWQYNDCPSASKATLMNMDKYFMWIHYERLHNHNKAKHNKTVCIFLGIYCMMAPWACITTAIWCCRKSVNPWQHSFQKKTALPMANRIADCEYSKVLSMDRC